MMAVLPHCNETQISVNWIDGEIRYYPNQHLYIGPFYLCFFCVAIVPQFFLFYTCLEKSSFGQSRCYKLMLIVCVCDIVNLCNCLLAAGTFTLFEIQHCNSGIWIVYYGQFVMLFWYAYCIANLILAINRLLEFLSPRLSTILFKGDRPFFWIAVIGIYALALCALSPHPFYFYDTDAGVWYFFWLGEDSTNYFHIYNNLIKLVLVVLCYAIMLLLLKKQLRTDYHTVSVFERRLSIQACIIALACAAGNITYCVISYLPMGNSPISGIFGEFFWGVQHSAAGFVYITMNSSVRKNVALFMRRLGHRRYKIQNVRSVSTNQNCGSPPFTH